MFTVELATIAHIPPFEEVTLRTSLDGWGDHDVVGTYRGDRWVFQLEGPRYLARFELKFVLNRSRWQQGENVPVTGVDGGVSTHYGSQVVFAPPTRPVVELGQVQAKLFDVAPPDPADRVYDVIVIGSGMAGGVLADRAADSGLSTLVLEVGGVPLETHVANLPRPHLPGQFHKHVWQRWYEYRAINYDQPADGSRNDYAGGQAFNLGGRSVFWGGFIPRMSSWELDFWPRQVKWDLEDRYYQLAEDLMGRSTAPTTFFTRQVHRLLRERLPDFAHFDAPMAVRVPPAGANTIATGMFAASDLLLESVRTGGAAGSQNLSVRTHHEAVSVAPGAINVVTTRDLLSGAVRRFRARSVVLCCGCIESARLARRSGLGNGLVGQGATDHPIVFTHFEVPPSSPYYDRFGTVKVVSQPTEPRPGGTRRREPFNMLLELGADFNQGRYLDEDILRQAAEKRSMLCELVFLANAELALGNRIDFDASNDHRPVPRIAAAVLDPGVRDRIDSITASLIDAMGGTRLATGVGGVGDVAHEVGSLRMRVIDSNNVAAGSQQELDGVVDGQGRFLGQDFDVYACDLSVFPTSPAANPSLTAVALAMRLADHLLQRLAVR